MPIVQMAVMKWNVVSEVKPGTSLVTNSKIETKSAYYLQAHQFLSATPRPNLIVVEGSVFTTVLFVTGDRIVQIGRTNRKINAE